jgi:hypothetical protein
MSGALESGDQPESDNIDESLEYSDDSLDDLGAPVQSALQKVISENQEILSELARIPRSQFNLQLALEQYYLTEFKEDSMEIVTTEKAPRGKSSQESAQPPSVPGDYLLLEGTPPEKEPVDEYDDYDEYDQYDEDGDEEGELAPDEFATMDEAQDYATEMAWEILEELLAEMAASEDDPLDVSDLDEEDKQEIVDEVVYPAVWAAMG